MKRLFPTIALCALALLGASHSARAIEWMQTNTFLVPPDTVETREIALWADQARIQGTLGDDLMALSDRFDFTGHADENLCVAGNLATFGGTIGRHLRVAAKVVEVDGAIGHNASLAGQTVFVKKTGRIGGESLLVGETVMVEGTLVGRARILAKQATLAGRFEGPVRIAAERIVLMPGASFGGDVVYSAEDELLPGERVEMKGRLIRKPLAYGSTPSEDEKDGASWTGKLAGAFFFYVGALLTGWIFQMIAPRWMARAGQAILASPGKAMLTGLITFAAMPMIALVLMISVVGLPAGLILLTLYGALLYLAKLAVGVALAARFMRRMPERPAGGLWLGLLPIYLIALLPWIGGAVTWVVLWLGLGGWLLGAYSLRNRPND